MKKKSKIECLADEETYDETSILAMKQDLLRVFFTLPDHLNKGYVIQMFRHGMWFDINYNVKTFVLVLLYWDFEFIDIIGDLFN